jgi:molecular chaperone HtpG
MNHSASRRINIPLRLKEQLKKDDSLSGAVISSLAEFAPWIDQSRMPFFPEYTDHGIDHIEGVLVTASSLISDEVWENCLMTSGDSAMLILSTLLHDSAMHLTEDGFVELVSDNERKIIGFDDKPWQSLWQDFYREARRFDERKLINLFGESTLPQIPNIDRIGDWTRNQRLLIGEFLRRHHHRLAHEIALYGVPGSYDGKKLKLKELSDDLENLAGLIARSHGVLIRSLLEYLNKNYHIRDFNGIHAVFLMVILRVSDYLQIQSERISEPSLRVQKLRSPISQGECNVHQAIRNISCENDDPELILVLANPPDVKTYLKLKRLLDNIQSELDSSWAVLGEIYGLHDRRNLDKLGLTIRRIKSNLDEPSFVEDIEYIPCKASFEAVPELLKLLIRPLYGDRPEFGIRELIQNSVDAVLELRKFRELKLDIKDEDLIPQEADVLVLLEKRDDSTWWLEVSDYGIGMTADTIRDYFLKAGASFRKSDVWFRNFTDEDDKSKVLRSGRFGIGILAAFLLGNEIRVSTRYAGSKPEDGIEFSATLDTDIIELHRIKLDIGTTISIKIGNELAEKLKSSAYKWDWYCLDNPKVVRKVRANGEETELQQKYHLPVSDSRLLPVWRRIKVAEYQDIHWTYSSVPSLTCNGIIVYHKENSSTEFPTEESSSMWYMAQNYKPFLNPHVSVFDPDGKLPLNLKRTAITQPDYPFRKQLFEDMAKDLIAYALLDAPDKPMNGVSSFSEEKFDFASTERHYGEEMIVFPWFYTKKGVSLVDRWHIENTGIKNILLIPTFFYEINDNIDNDILAQKLYCEEINAIFLFYFVVGHEAEFRNSNTWPKFAIIGESRIEAFSDAVKYKVSGRRLLVGKKHIDKFRKIISPYKEQHSIKEEYKAEKWSIYRMGICPGDSKKFEDIIESVIIKNSKTEDFPMIAEWYLTEKYHDIIKDTLETKYQISPIAQVWQEILDSPIIPYDLDERNNIIERVSGTLGTYIEAHRILSKQRIEDENIEHKELS